MKMSKIEKIKALELIRKKYPKADFWYSEESKKFNIAFNGEGSKVYSYRCYNTLDFLKRIKVVEEKVVYLKDYEIIKENIKHLKRYIFELENKDEEDFIFLFDTKESMIKDKKEELEKMQKSFESLMILNI